MPRNTQHTYTASPVNHESAEKVRSAQYHRETRTTTVSGAAAPSSTSGASPALTRPHLLHGSTHARARAPLPSQRVVPPLSLLVGSARRVAVGGRAGASVVSYRAPLLALAALNSRLAVASRATPSRANQTQELPSPLASPHSGRRTRKTTPHRRRASFTAVLPARARPARHPPGAGARGVEGGNGGPVRRPGRASD